MLLPHWSGLLKHLQNYLHSMLLPHIGASR